MHYQREHYFNSFDEFNCAPHGWDADFSTTSKKNYKVILQQSATPGLLLNTAWLGSPTLQQATTPAGMRTFALPLRLPHAYCWRGLSVNEKTFMAFPSDRELFSMMGADSEVLTVSVDEGLVDGCLQNWDINPDELFQLPRTADLSALQYRAMRQNLQMMSEFMVKYGNLQRFPDLSRGIRELLIEDMLQPVLGQLDHPTIGKSAATRRVKKAADYILSRLDQAITVDDVCKQVGCSRRSLEPVSYTHLRAHET